MKLLIVIIASFVLVGCQSKKGAVEVICSAADQPEIASATPDMRSTLIARHIEENVGNAEVQALFKSMAAMKPESRVAAIQALMDETGVTECSLLTVMGPQQPPN